MVTIEPEPIPSELKERDQWLLWDDDNDTPRQPHWRGDFGISWSDPNDWHSFDDACAAAREQDSWGIGYVMAADNDSHPRGIYGCLDLDGAVGDDGRPADWVPSLQEFFDGDCYIEYSPSGGGIHIPLVGQETPDWWTDQQFADDEHTGVDWLTNKFCTFTGHTVDNRDTGQVGDVDPGPWLLKVYQEINGELPRLETPDAETYDGDRELTEEHVESALESLDANMPQPEWIRVAYAVHDWDNGGSGRALFEAWSRSGSKFDDSAKRQIEHLWSGADPGNGVTVGTLIHKAQENGWEFPGPEPPAQLDDTQPDATGPSDDGDDSSDSSTEEVWDYVRAVYQEQDNGSGRLAATKALEGETHWMYVVESEKLWVYDDRGYFNAWGSEHAKARLETELGEHYSQAECREIVDRIQARHQTHRKELNARNHGSPVLCVGNGVVDLETGELAPHSPDFNFTRGLSWDYDPERADTDAIVEFLDDVTKRECDRDTLLDHLAHGLMPGHPYRAFVIMYGPGSNGKTRVGKLFRGFVGEENAASVELQALTGDDQFATGALPGAFVNVGDDISVGQVRDTSILKSVTGDGTIRANEKHEKQYEFENEAAMFFSANEPPRFKEQSEAVSDRLYPIQMPYRFVDEPDAENEKQKVPGIAERLLEDDAAMRGLLALAVQHAQDVRERNGEYSMPESPRERRELYESASDPIQRFALEHLQQGSGSDKILKADAYDVYAEMCDREGERAASEDSFKQLVSQMASLDSENIQTRTLTEGDSRDYAWGYVHFAESAQQFMPGRLQERYFGDSAADESEEQPAEGSEDGDDGSVSHVMPLADAAESLTGYVSVTAEIATVDTFETENSETTKVVLVDDSAAMDFVTWDETMAGRLRDLVGKTVLLERAEVDEYQGTRQLRSLEGVTELREVQRGVGHTEYADTDDGQEALAETDGSENRGEGGVPEDAIDPQADADRLVSVLHEISTPAASGVLVEELGSRDLMPPDRAEVVIDHALEDGSIIRTGAGLEVNR